MDEAPPPYSPPPFSFRAALLTFLAEATPIGLTAVVLSFFMPYKTAQERWGVATFFAFFIWGMVSCVIFTLLSATTPRPAPTKHHDEEECHHHHYYGGSSSNSDIFFWLWLCDRPHGNGGGDCNCDCGDCGKDAAPIILVVVACVMCIGATFGYILIAPYIYGKIYWWLHKDKSWQPVAGEMGMIV